MKKYKNNLLFILTVTILVLAGCRNNRSPEEPDHSKAEDIESTKAPVDMSGWKVPVDFPNGELLSGTHHVDIVIKDFGTVSVELDADTAPISVSNFMYLAQSGFYKGLTFHRIIDGFMMQGGAPGMTGQKADSIKGEFSVNGVENSISHVRGTISMARSSEYDSASSQFFIVHQDSLHLDGQYAGFGHVTEGMEYVDAICSNRDIQGDNGSIEPQNQPVIEDVIVID